MIKSSFFNAVLDDHGNPDRVYDAEIFAKYFSSFIGNGVFPNPSTGFQIITNNDMTVKYMPGMAWINGYFAFDESEYNINIEPADGILNRIDRIVLRYDNLKRTIEMVINKGDFATEPIPKGVQRTADMYEIVLADVYVGKGVTSISQSAITDRRLDSELCGIVHGTVDQIDTETFMIQLEKWKTEYISRTNTWTSEQEALFTEWKNLFESDSLKWKELQEKAFTNWSTEQKELFNTWFNAIKNQLSTDQAGNLQNQINDSNSRIDGEIEKSNNRIAKLESERRVYYELTMNSSTWIGNKYSFEGTYPSANYDMEIALNSTANEEEKNAWSNASMASSFNKNEAVALEDIPAINIPIIAKVVKR